MGYGVMFHHFYDDRHCEGLFAAAQLFGILLGPRGSEGETHNRMVVRLATAHRQPE